MRQILFTGACGYIGSHSVYHFLQNTTYNITIIDNLSSGFMENLRFLESKFGDRISFLKLDLGDSLAMRNLFSQYSFDCVVHFAASLIVPESVEKPLLYYSNNTKNTLDLVALCVEFGVNKFIFSSTAAVYGDAKEIPISEDSPLMPINPYGSSKMMSEYILRDTSKANANFNYVALRYFNVAGALSDNLDSLNLDSMDSLNANLMEFIESKESKKSIGLGQRTKNATHLIKVACECAVGKRDCVSIFGSDYDTKDGTCIRDYIHIDDLALAHLSAYEFLEKHHKSEVFNVGYGRGFSVKEVINKVKEISGIDFKTTLVARRAGDPENLIANNSKILNLTLWRPKYDNLDIIIKSAYEWEKSLKYLDLQNK